MNRLVGDKVARVPLKPKVDLLRNSLIGFGFGAGVKIGAVLD